jgi:hypothetical protein
MPLVCNLDHRVPEEEESASVLNRLIGDARLVPAASITANILRIRLS